MVALDLLTRTVPKISTTTTDVAIQTDAGSGWNRGLADPEGHPGEDHQQGGGNVGLQDKVEAAPLQLQVEHQLGVVA